MGWCGKWGVETGESWRLKPPRSFETVGRKRMNSDNPERVEDVHKPLLEGGLALTNILKSRAKKDN